MIHVRLAAQRRAARVTGLILGAALLRTLLLPAGDLFSTIVFAGCLLAICLFERASATNESGWGRRKSLVAGLMAGAILLAPVVSGPLGARPLSGLLPWAAIAAMVATLEETSIRGVLYRRLAGEAGTIAAIVIGAAVFALIHLPRYGLGAMPLDAAVGLALGGLRALTGRVLPGAVAHTMADWGAWFWA